MIPRESVFDWPTLRSSRHIFGMRAHDLGLLTATLFIHCACMGELTDPSAPAGGPNPGPEGAQPPALGPGMDLDGDGVPDPPTTTPAGVVCDSSFRGSAAPMRFLTNVEFDNTIRDLLGLSESVTQDLPSDTPPHGFDNNAAQSGYSQLRVRRMFDAAEKAGDLYAQNPIDLSCALEAADPACLDLFYDNLGRRAFRRSLNPAEKASLAGVWNDLVELSPRERLAAVVQAMLVSFQLNFRPELGDSAAAVPADGYVALAGEEVATRMSYFLWNSLPDAELFAAAASGALSTADGIRQQAKRLLAHPRARGSIGNFADQWLGTRRLPDKPDKDSVWFPTYTPDLVTAMRRELQSFVADAVLRGPSGFSQLLTGTTTTVNAALAEVYGVPAPAEGADGWGPVNLPSAQRRGVLTTPGFLSVHAQNKYPSPITRGLFVLTELRCQTIAAPPPGATTMGSEAPGTAPTNRETKEAHSNNPVCRGCHTLIDPPGYAFEIYDAVGHYQTTERVADGTAKTVNATANVVGTDFDGTYQNALEMIPRLAESKEVRSCVATQLFRYAQGRLETEADACNIALLTSALERSGGDLAELMVNLMSADPFRSRPVGG